MRSGGERDTDGTTARGVRGVALGLSAALLISLTNVFSRLHFEAGSNPVTFLLARYVLFVAVVALVLGALGALPRIDRARWPDLLAAGLLNVAGAASLAFAIERLPVGLAVAVLYLFPILTLLIDSAVRRRAPSARTLGATSAGPEITRASRWPPAFMRLTSSVWVTPSIGVSPAS